MKKATNDGDPKNIELVWDASLSLAQLNQPGVADTILMLLDRKQLDELQIYDRETDPQNPMFREVAKNFLKSRLRSHPDVARRHHADLLDPTDREGPIQAVAY